MAINEILFNPVKLTEAREARGQSITDLAGLSGISRQSITSYEKGDSIPRLEHLIQLADTLKFDLHFFSSEKDEFSNNLVFFRSLRSTTQRDRKKLEWRLIWLKRLFVLLSDFIDFPEIKFPNFDIQENHLEKSSFNNDIENFAIETRKFWNLGFGQISNMVNLAESCGIIIARGEAESEKIDAFSEWSYKDKLVPIVFLNTEKQSAFRSRFDLAHEIGHLILHKNLSPGFINNRNLKLIEDQANRFASAFLMPKITFEKTFIYPSLDHYIQLKSRWLTSIAALIVRSKQLDLITETTERRLWINYSKREYRKREPLDDTLTMEKPRVLIKAIDLLDDKGILKKNEIISRLGLSSLDLTTLLDVEKDYFSDYSLKTNPSLKIFSIKNPT